MVRKKASASFFAKREAKKLLFAGGVGPSVGTTPSKQKFFASFFQKRSASFPLIILFARAPRLGTVKRRLAAGIGAVPALRFYRNQLARILRALRPFSAVLAITPDRAAFRPLPRIPVIPQGHGDLGARMHNAFRRFPRRPVILIGADIPELGPEDLRRATKLLRHHDAVFGPAADGGYYLVAMSARRPSAPFANVRWSTEHALADTERHFRHLRVAKLRMLQDVDTAENLKTHTPAGHCGAA